MIRNAFTACLIWLADVFQFFTEVLLQTAKRRVRQDIFKRDGVKK